MNPVEKILGSDEDSSKIGKCQLCGKKGVKIWPCHGGRDWRCAECD